METMTKRIYVGQQWFAIINEDNNHVVVQKTNHVDGEWELDGQPINLPRASFEVWRGEEDDIKQGYIPRSQARPMPNLPAWDSFGINAEPDDSPEEINAKRYGLYFKHHMNDLNLWDDERGQA